GGPPPSPPADALEHPRASSWLQPPGLGCSNGLAQRRPSDLASGRVEPAPRMPSRTALLTAAARGLHREEPPPWVLDDWLAVRLGGEEAVRMGEMLRDQLPPPALLAFSRWVCVRGRRSEDIVERAAVAAVRQCVIVGAGLDSFAYRRADLLERMRLFEVDHPVSQHWKRRRLHELGIDPPANLVYAPVDFERQALRDGLTAAGCDFAA